MEAMKAYISRPVWKKFRAVQEEHELAQNVLLVAPLIQR